MRKLLVAFSFFAFSTFSFAGSGDKYKVNDAAVDQMFAESQDISSSFVDEMQLAGMNQPMAMKNADGAQTIGGFLIRDLCCGFIALHRTYMGGKDLAWKYCLTTILIANIPGAVDFFWVLIVGNDALSKYKGNDKFLVWL